MQRSVEIGIRAVSSLARAIKQTHYLLAPRNNRQRAARANHFAERGNIGQNSRLRLRASVGDTKAGDDFIKNQHRTQTRAQVSQALQKFFLSANDALDGLNDDARKISGVFLGNARCGIQIVIRCNQHAVACARRRAVRVRRALRIIAHQVRKSRDHRIIMVAVIGALELHHLFAARECACQSHRVCRRFGARRCVGNLLGARNVADQTLCQSHRNIACDTEHVHPALGLFLHCFHQRRVRVAQYQGSGTAGIVDIFAALGIPKARTFAMRENKPVGLRRRAPADTVAGKVLLRRLRKGVVTHR